MTKIKNVGMMALPILFDSSSIIFDYAGINISQPPLTLQIAAEQKRKNKETGAINWVERVINNALPRKPVASAAEENNYIIAVASIKRASEEVLLILLERNVLAHILTKMSICAIILT